MRVIHKPDFFTVVETGDAREGELETSCEAVEGIIVINLLAEARDVVATDLIELVMGDEPRDGGVVLLIGGDESVGGPWLPTANMVPLPIIPEFLIAGEPVTEGEGEATVVHDGVPLVALELGGGVEEVFAD